MKSIITFFTLLAVCGRLYAMDAQAVRSALTQESDFTVLILGVHLDKFDMGFFEVSADSNERSRLRIHRDGSIDFFRNQKHKGMILIRYYAAPIEDWDIEIARTVKYFQNAGYLRVVLMEEYGQVPGITILHDTLGQYTKGQFIAFEDTSNKK
jgi:hypothetical protein